jgi:putative flippase GtrA
VTTVANKTRRVYDRHGEKMRYLVVGVWNTAFSYALFWTGIHLFAGQVESATGVDPKLAAVIIQWGSWVLAVVQSTVTMKYLAFRSRGHLGKQIVRAYFIYLPAQGLSSVILWTAMLALSPGLGDRLAAVLGQLVAIAVTTVFSYFGHKFFTFRIPLEVGEVPPQDLVEGDGEGVAEVAVQPGQPTD